MRLPNLFPGRFSALDSFLARLARLRQLRLHVVDGIERDFNGHGYSAPHSYYVSAEESCMRQGDFEGMCHPNDRGLEFVRARLTCALARQLTMSDTAMVPALHLNMMS